MAVPPLVSIVVATFRPRADQLEQALSSALAQRWPAIEVLVRDDAPEGSARDIVARFGDPRLRYHHNVPTLGVAANHWRAFDAAMGEFIAVLNHDDLLEPSFVPTLLAPLLSDDWADIAFCDHWVLDADGFRLPEASDANTRDWGRDRLARGWQADVASLVVRQTMPVAMGTLFRRRALPRELPPDAGPAYDLWLGYLLARGGGRVWYEPQRLSAWRRHENNLTSAAGLDWLRGAATCWESIAADARFAAVRVAARERAALAHYACAMRCWADQRPPEARRHAQRSLRYALGWRAGAAWSASWLPPGLAPRRWQRAARLQ